EADGDLDVAAEAMRKAGLAKADKKASRVAAEGVIALARSEDGKQAAVVEVNCETDFVAREPDFRKFADDVASLVLATSPADTSALLAASLGEQGSVDDVRRALIAKIGENIDVRRFAVVQAEAVV